MPEISKKQAFLDKLKELKGKASEKLNQFIETTGPAVKEGLINTGTALKKGFGKAKSWTKDKIDYLKSDEFKEKVEEFKEDLSDAMEDIKLSAEDKLEDLKEKAMHSKKGRAIAIKGVTNAIRKLNPQNSRGIERLDKIIESFGLCDPEYGQIIDKKDMMVLAEKLKQNPEYQSEAEELIQELKEYPEPGQVQEEPKPKIEKISLEEIENVRGFTDQFFHETSHSASEREMPQKNGANPRFKIISEADIAFGSKPIEISTKTASPAINIKDTRFPDQKADSLPNIQTLGGAKRIPNLKEIEENLGGPTLE